MKNQQASEAIALGQRMLAKSLRHFNMSYDGLTEEHRTLFIEELKLNDWERLLSELGTGNRMAPLVAKQIHDIVLGTDDEIGPKNDNSDAALPISGTEGMLVHFANCCHPIPGDEILGFVSTEKGLVIHRETCHNIKHIRNQPDKCLDVQWDPNTTSTFLTEVQIEAKNQRGTLAIIANEIAKTNTDIERVRSEDKDESYSLMHFVINVRDRVHLAQVMKRLKRLPIVEKIQRI